MPNFFPTINLAHAACQQSVKNLVIIITVFKERTFERLKKCDVIGSKKSDNKLTLISK